MVAVWTLSQLNHRDAQNLICKIDDSLKDVGYLVLIEPVLGDDERQWERAAKVEEEGHVARIESTYQRFFKGPRLEVVHQEKAKMADLCDEWMMLYILKKGNWVLR